MRNEKKICVVIPCFNEAVTIEKVINDFRKELPDAEIIVINNNSTDKTEEIALKAGAKIIREPRQGKGFVIDRMFTEVKSDIYIMVDGDDTYPAEAVHSLLIPITEGQAEIVVGSRLEDHSNKAFRKFHKFGNNLVRSLVNHIGNANLKDIMSGYRVFTKEIVNKIPVLTSGFEIETEFTIQMLYYNTKIVEVDVPYRERPEGSFSKLNTIQDGFKVIVLIFQLLRAFRPMQFFGLIALFFMFLSLSAGFFPINDYLTNPNHYVEHVPLAILATGLAMLSFAFFFLGIILHVINYRIKELHNIIVRRS